MNAYLKAVFLSLGAYTCWIVGDACLKLMGETGVPMHEIIAFNGLGSGATVGVIAILCGNLKKLKPHRIDRIIWLGLALLVEVFAIIAALKNLPLANYSVIIFAMPLLVAGIAALVLKERLMIVQWLAIVAGFLGVIVTIDPVRLLNGQGSLFGYVAALVTAFLAAVTIIIVRVLGKTESSESLAFYPALLLAVGGVVIGLVTHVVMPRPIEFFYMLASGVVGGIGWQCLSLATQSATASDVAPFQYSQVITGAVIGFLIWHDVPTWNLAVGAVIIAAAGFYLTHYIRKMA